MLKLFYSYSHSDEPFRIQLEKHLSILKRNGILDEWHDRKIIPGEEWHEVIDNNLSAANIILLLISADFIASNYCYEVEMRKAMELHDAGKSAVVPVIIRPCLWSDTSFSKLQGLPKDGKPISTWSNIDEAWLNVAEGIRNLCMKIRHASDSVHNATATARSRSFSITTEFELRLDAKVTLINNDLGSFSRDSRVAITGIRDFDRVIRWPSVVTYGSSQITSSGLRYLGKEKPYGNQEYVYTLDASRDGSLRYNEQFTWNDVDDIIFNVERFVQELFFFIHYSSTWVKRISRLHSFKEMTELSVSLSIPQSCILAAPMDLVNDALQSPKKISNDILHSSVSLKSLEYVRLADVSRLCEELLKPILSEFSFEFNRQVGFPSLHEEALEQRIAHLTKTIEGKGTAG